MKQKSNFSPSNLFIFASCVFIFVFATGCPPSMVYSPSVNLPPRPLESGQEQFLVGFGMFPEARPHEVSGSTAIGGEATIRFALSDYFSLQTKGWLDLSSNVDFTRYGFSISTLIMLNSDRSSYRIGIMPTGALLFSSSGFGAVEGGGGVLPICLWFPNYKDLSFYVALGPGFGTRNFPIEKNQWGWGILLNVGASIFLSDHFTMNLEVSGILQNNEYENLSDFIVAPSINLGILF